MLRRVLLPVDGSNDSFVDRLAFFFRQTGPEVIVLRVLDLHEGGLLGRLWAGSRTHAELAKEAKEQVDALAARLNAGGVHARGLVEQGRTSGTIARCAGEQQASLVVMATHGRVGLDRLAHGSVTEQLVERAPAPVLVVPIVQSAKEAASLPKEWSFAHVLVPVDDTDVSLEVVSQLGDIERAFGSQFTLLHVAPRDGDPSITAAARGYLEVARQRFQQEGLPVKTVLRFGDPAEEVLDLCDEGGIDCIAMTTHAETGFAHWILGSVASSVIQDSLLPVLVTRSRRPPFPTPAC